MAILTINGSTSIDGVNSKLLDSLEFTFPQVQFEKFNILKLPLFQVALDRNPLPASVVQFRNTVGNADALIISTPVYIYNIPAVLKSALEWLASSGELVGQRVLPITYTPNPPRGEKAMLSLLNSLKALDANVVTALDLYQTELKIINQKIEGSDQIELLSGALELLKD